MDDPEEYEVESVTRARVHDKKGKKITWTYYVKWKGYSWDESTWEPADSFQGSEHILQSFWERIDAGGRDITDGTAFKKGEELLISGPPGKKGLKRKASSLKTTVSPPSKIDPGSNGMSISAPVPASRKRRRVQSTVDNECGYSKPRKLSARGHRSGGTSAASPERVSSPGPRKPAPKRFPSAGDSQLDADGETDPDVVEVEDELMHVSAEDAEDVAGRQQLVPAKESANRIGGVEFDDLEHFYSGNPIDIDQNAEESTVRKPQDRSPSTPTNAAPTSPALTTHDPLFDSPLRPSDKPSEAQKGSLPHHRTRAAKPLVKFLDSSTVEATSKQTRITAKARLLSVSSSSKDVPPTSGPSRNAAKRGKKPGPGQSSSGLITRNRSSLLTADKGTLKSVKGKYTPTASERDQPDEIEEAPLPGDGDKAEGDKLIVTSWSDEDVVVDQDQAMVKSQTGLHPSGSELLRLAGLHKEPEALPDYEDNLEGQSQGAEETQTSNSTSAQVEEVARDQSDQVMEEPKASDGIANTSLSVLETAQQAATSVTSEPSVLTVAPPVDDAIKNNIELAKEHLFPSIQTSLNSFGTTQSSFRSTIFGPLYQGLPTNFVPVAENGSSATFKVVLGDGVELPLVLKDCGEIKPRISDILIGKSSGSKVALFYSAEDAGAMVSTFKSDSTARVVLDPAAEAMQQDHFSTFLQRFEASHTLIAPAGKEVCVLYSSENTSVAERLGTPKHLRGLARTLLVSHASIENQLAYVAAIMKATAL